MTLVDLSITGLEQVQRQAFYVLFDNLNDALTEIAATMDVSDEEFATRTGALPFVPTEIEQIAVENFYEGHRPSLIGADIARYPNVAVMANKAQPSGDDFDQISVYRDQLTIEVMVKSETSEEEVNRRVHRTTEAVHACIMGNQSLNGTVSGLETTPVMAISDVFTRKERTAYGPHWFWQGSRLEYAVRKEAVIPSSSSGSFFRAADIDQ